jgi:hypothetical protein
MFDPAILDSAEGKYVNAKYLKTIPQMATKVRIIDGGSRQVDDRDNPGKKKTEVFLTVESTIGTFDGAKDMTLNKSNMTTLLSGLGSNPNSWKGREIGLYFDPTVKFGNDVVGGMKVKVFEADPFAKMAAVAPTAAPVEADAIPF